ncbi:MAG: helix-turn-helix transcriptional regulator [Terrisporobacter othiniensis]|uniref:helix-turn-helix domain-containing protein n=1 Tax=Terrisporobacter petrolearius TaxID=1460447 RepID=UPI0022E594A3|nr:helix-turn-helix transcriptional regulator [Terrisporobacter petrolearius]MDU4861715.1 helix-turn-helix transcriptional regulator [Terrisporobacter othiniensis]MDU6995368.1 helix-turn-helix transcriptional regulator [Terrisporobacter othiniensis]
MNTSCGYKIRKLRHNKKETLDQVAHSIGISSSALGMYERGMRNPDMKVLLKISEYFDVDLGYFYEGSYDEIHTIKEVLKQETYSIADLEKAKKRAKCNCELCGNRAPFYTNNGEPYLEVYKLDDTNVKGDAILLLCPNCKKKVEVLNLQSDINYLMKVATSEEI